MKIARTTLMAAGILASTNGIDALPASALPALEPGIMARTDNSQKVEKAWYRCGYYRCHRRFYGYYHPYRYGYYGGYGYYHPHIGVRLGGIGLGFY